MKVPAVLTRLANAIRPKAYTGVPSIGNWWGVVRESFAGAFQANIEVDPPRSVVAFSAVFACTTLISSDIAKLDIKLVEETEDGICEKAPSTAPFWRVLRKPNHFQTRVQFMSNWMVSKLLYGNTYILKERDGRGMVSALYILDAQRVTPLVATNGDVYYKLAADHLAGLPDSITVPAREIIHDRMCCLWHPLVGISPLYAAGMSATMGNKIQNNSATFFKNMSRPSGMLTAPNEITDETAARLKLEFERNMGGANIGRLFVGGDGLSYSPMTMPAETAQLIEQLNWTAVDVARAFHMPGFKIGAGDGKESSGLSVDAQAQQYLNDCLHIHIEDIESCLEDGLETEKAGYEIEIDEEGMLRMDFTAKAKAFGELVKNTIMASNEARAKFNLPPVAGGESPLAQQQNYSLAALAKRDAMPDPFAPDATAPEPTPAPDAPAAPAKDYTAELLLEFQQRAKELPTLKLTQEPAHA